jgi:hypothetical protein
MMGMTVADLNRRNKGFWAAQRKLMEARLADEAIYETAFETIRSESTRQVPVRNQKSVESTLEDAATAQHRFSSQLARAGGKAKKLDALGRLIVGIVRTNRNISVPWLLVELENNKGGPIIDDIDDQWIHFRSSSARPRGIPLNRSEADEVIEKKVILDKSRISGLKHRLTRARKIILQEIQSR